MQGMKIEELERRFKEFEKSLTGNREPDSTNTLNMEDESFIKSMVLRAEGKHKPEANQASRMRTHAHSNDHLSDTLTHEDEAFIEKALKKVRGQR
jgi:hypothetical protein